MRDRSQEGQGKGSQAWWAEAGRGTGRRLWLWEPGPIRGKGWRQDWIFLRINGNSCGRVGECRGSLTPHIPSGPLWSGEAVCTWLPPLLGFTNTSRGFMRGDGVGLMMKGLQRPSLETERARKTPSCPGGVYPHAQWCPGCPSCTTPGSDLLGGLTIGQQLGSDLPHSSGP